MVLARSGVRGMSVEEPLDLVPYSPALIIHSYMRRL